MKQLKIFTLILLVAFSLSCNKESDDSTVIGDAIIVSKRSGTNVVYGVALYAYAYSSLKTVTAVSSLEPSNAVSLAANGSYTYNFLKEPSDMEYSETAPAATIYTFSGVFDSGGTFECQDILTSDALLRYLSKNAHIIRQVRMLSLAGPPCQMPTAMLFML